MSQAVYMYLTDDKYELPIAVADTARELGEMIGKSANLVLSSISHGYPRYCKVVIDEDE